MLPRCAEGVMATGITFSICTTRSQIKYCYVQATLLPLDVIATFLRYREQSKIDIVACTVEMGHGLQRGKMEFWKAFSKDWSTRLRPGAFK